MNWWFGFNSATVVAVFSVYSVGTCNEISHLQFFIFSSHSPVDLSKKKITHKYKKDCPI